MSGKFKNCAFAAIVGTSLFVFQHAATAHHSKALQFDMNAEITVEGNIVELEWRNPHAWLNIEVENEAGELELWRIEFSNANSLLRRG